ncbi:MAG TPA: hypothetical protein VMT03_02150 [Polyangia bacterium]|nr:hypothetical protein [Polyangia bacterium]
MRRIWLGTWALAAGVAFLSRAAAAPANGTGAGASAGIASALGYGGVTLTQAFVEHARLELGGGYGYTGWQLSAMPKFATGSGAWRFVTGPGISVAIPTDSRRTTGHPVWLNLDLGAEYDLSESFTVAAAAGLTAGLGGGDLCLPIDHCDTANPGKLHPVTNYWIPQGRVGFIYWF